MIHKRCYSEHHDNQTKFSGFKEERCPHPLGQGVGGSSLLNALFYTRTHPKDFEKWGAENPGWNYSQILPYYLKTEDFKPSDTKYPVDKLWHREGGPLQVNYPAPLSPKTEHFVKSYEQLGYNYTDLNGRYHVGIMAPMMNTKHGKRQDAGTAFLLPILSRPNLKVLPKSFVTKILINATTKTTEGVLFARNKKLYRAKVTKDVIVSAGAINSAQILMLSGVGPKAHLESLGKLLSFFMNI